MTERLRYKLIGLVSAPLSSPYARCSVPACKSNAGYDPLIN